MRFGRVDIADADGAILAHSQKVGRLRLKKGTILDKSHLAALREAGVESVVAAEMEAGDVLEDVAAARIADALRIRGISKREAATGRVNLHATDPGVFMVSKPQIDAINAVDPAITIATLVPFRPVGRDQMVATIKIIPFALHTDLVDAVCGLASNEEVMAVEGFRARRVGLVQTELPAVKPGVLTKTRRVTEARLARSGSRVVDEVRCGHTAPEIAEAIQRLQGDAEMILVFGASAMTDPADVIPSAIHRLGGMVERVGMPVDPGNLLVLGHVGNTAVLAAPGCARSPKENGFDWVLDRLMADIPVTAGDLASMGVGGLLTEIASRPRPREPATEDGTATVHAAVLAAGRSSRMAGPNKLLALFDDVPLVRRSAERAIASRVSGVTLIVGHQADQVRVAVSGLDMEIRDNPDFANGLSSSLQAAVMAVPDDAAGLMIVLADMPGITTAAINSLVAVFKEQGGRSIVRATDHGKRGNPVILPRQVFAEVLRLDGDTGARHLVERSIAPVIDVEIGAAASLDVDTPQAMQEAGGVLID